MLDAEAIAMLKKAPTYYVPTLYISQVVPDNPKVPESERERGRRLRDRQLQSFRDALAAGLSIGLATDVPVMPHGQNAKEMTFRVSLGESPMSALVSATRVNAEILGWSDRVGTVEPGKWPTSWRSRATAAGHHTHRACRLRDEGRSRVQGRADPPLSYVWPLSPSAAWPAGGCAGDLQQVVVAVASAEQLGEQVGVARQRP